MIYLETFSPNFYLIYTFTLFGRSLSKSTSILILAQLGLILLLVAISICNSLPTVAANQKIVFFPKKLGGKAGNEIHPIYIDVLSLRSKSESY